MFSKVSTLIIFMFFTLSTLCFAQAPDYSQLDPEPYTPGVDSDIDMYMNSWQKSPPKHTHGSLIEREILTKGNPDNPPRKGAVLTYMNRYSHATLDAHYSTAPTTLKGEQEVFYVYSGKGIIRAGKITADLYKGIGVLVPSNLEFVITNPGDEPLMMYLVNEPVPDDFRVNTEIIVRNENTIPYSTSNVHWSMIFKRLFGTNDGLYHIQSILTVNFAPMTMGQPHSHVKDCEETWLSLEGDVHLLFGKQLRKQPPGTAYMIPPDGNTPHAQINVSDKPIKMYHVARYNEHEVRK